MPEPDALDAIGEHATCMYIEDQGYRIPAVFKHYPIGLVRKEIDKYQAFYSAPDNKFSQDVLDCLSWLKWREKQLMALELIDPKPASPQLTVPDDRLYDYYSNKRGIKKVPY